MAAVVLACVRYASAAARGMATLPAVLSRAAAAAAAAEVAVAHAADRTAGVIATGATVYLLCCTSPRRCRPCWSPMRDCGAAQTLPAGFDGDAAIAMAMAPPDHWQSPPFRHHTDHHPGFHATARTTS